MRLIFADIHCANHKDFGDILENGRNARLQACLDVLEEILLFCTRNQITHVDFLGDLFHTKDRIDTVVYDAVFDIIEKFGLVGINLYLLAGNHDQALKDGSITSLKPLRNIKNITIITEPCIIGDTYYIPYQDKWKNRLLSNMEAKYLMLHQGITEAAVGPSNYFIGTGISFLELKKYEKVFVGHYHRYQKFGNTYIVGSPIQHNFGERGEKKGFLLLHDNSRVEFLSTPNAREFKVVEVKEREDLIGFTKRDYVKFIVKSKRMKNFNFSSVSDHHKVEVELPRKFEQRLEIKQEETEDQILENYIQQFKGEIVAAGLDVQTLREMSKAIWKKYNEIQ